MTQAPQAAAVATLVVLLLGLQCEIAAASTIDYDNPVRSAREDKVEYASNSSVNFYAGYLKAHADGKPEQFLYYWFVESESRPDLDPLVLWLNGGPGASSLRFPLDEATGQISLVGGRAVPVSRDYSWNKLANMLYIEGPVGVGFSYSKQPVKLNDDTTAEANYFALKSFMRKFPRFLKNRLYLTGVSYAGVYVPTLGVLVDEDRQLNLKGIAIENGLFDLSLQQSSLALFAYYHSLLDEIDLVDVEDFCCDGQPISRKAGNFFSGVELSKNCMRSLQQIDKKLMRSLSGTNVNNIYETASDNVLQSSEDNGCHVRLSNGSWKEFATVEARERIHVPARLRETQLIKYCLQYPRLPGGVASQMKTLIESQRNLTVFVFNGDLDLKCNSVGTKWFLDDLHRQDPRSRFVPWYHNNKIAGLVQQYGGFTFATVLGAGHVPTSDKPKLGYSMMKKFLNSDGAQNVFGFDTRHLSSVANE